MKHTVVITAVLSLGILAGCGGEKHDQAAQAPPPVQVESEGGVSLITVDHPNRFPVVAATKYQSTSTLNVTGTVNPDISREIPVISIASGRVVAIHTQIGAFVQKGQLIMEVQSTDISNAFDQYLKAVNDERLARTQDERAKILYEKGAIAKSQLEIADDAEQDAKADLSGSGTAVDRSRRRQRPSLTNGQGLFPGNRCRHRAKCHQRRCNRRRRSLDRRRRSPSPISLTCGSSAMFMKTICPWSTSARPPIFG